MLLQIQIRIGFKVAKMTGFVKTRIRNAFRFIKIEEVHLNDVAGFVEEGKQRKISTEVSLEKILIILLFTPALAAHSINYQETLKFRLIDQDSTPISGQDFEGIIEQYHKSGSFFIEIIIINAVADNGNDLAEVFIQLDFQIQSGITLRFIFQRAWIITSSRLTITS